MAAVMRVLPTPKINNTGTVRGRITTTTKNAIEGEKGVAEITAATTSTGVVAVMVTIIACHISLQLVIWMCYVIVFLHFRRLTPFVQATSHLTVFWALPRTTSSVAFVIIQVTLPPNVHFAPPVTTQRHLLLHWRPCPTAMSTRQCGSLTLGCLLT